MDFNDYYDYSTKRFAEMILYAFFFLIMLSVLMIIFRFNEVSLSVDIPISILRLSYYSLTVFLLLISFYFGKVRAKQLFNRYSEMIDDGKNFEKRILLNRYYNSYYYSFFCLGIIWHFGIFLQMIEGSFIRMTVLLSLSMLGMIFFLPIDIVYNHFIFKMANIKNLFRK